ncbi:MAG: Coenzyme F420 hydrogenase/dehydrogenase, beta subunit C-terminal domain [Rikenellaceae bacterium]|nr:Coenzyme F420 hydrogenase/dehydrogenase, beta subunit C-terminal domain [Rikenellaceae bacterium]
MALKPTLATRRTCTGCMACVDSCAHSALESYMARDGHLYVRWNRTDCTGCGACSRTCPVITPHKPEPGKPGIRAAWANDERLRMKSSSGGVFAALAVQTLAEGGVVFGAAMKGTQVVHRAVERIDDLEALQGSKYQQGDLSGVYRKVRKYLREGRAVLFSGVPCQVAGLYGMLGGKRPDNLLAVDLVCSGFPSLLPLQSFLKHEPYGRVETLTYRDKRDGWYDDAKQRISSQDLTLYPEDGTPVKLYSGLVYSAFGSHLTNRSSCLNCPFARAHRLADLTLADYWGDRDYPDQHYAGLSAVVVHSRKGLEAISKADLTVHPSTWAKFLHSCYRMVCGRHPFIRLHPGRWLRTFAFTRGSYALQQHLFYVKPMTLLTFPYRAWGGFLFRMSGMWIDRVVKHAINNLDT